MGANFRTFGNLKDIPERELTESEKIIMDKYPDIEIFRTEDSYSGGNFRSKGARIYLFVGKDENGNTIKHKGKIQSALESKDVFGQVKRCNTALEKAQSNFPNYTFEIIGYTDKSSPIYKIIHYDERLKPIITPILRDVSRVKNPKDPFAIEYSKYKKLDKAREKMPNYIIEFYDLHNSHDASKIDCIVTYPNNKYGLEPRIRKLSGLEKGEDPFYNDISILNTLKKVRRLNKEYTINLTDKYNGSMIICSVEGTSPQTKDKEIRYMELNRLSSGDNPFKNDSWRDVSENTGYFYILQCINNNKIGIMYGVTINPYKRLSVHRKYNKNIETKTTLLGLYKNPISEDKNIILDLERNVKRNIQMNYFNKDECSTNTETCKFTKYKELIEMINQYNVIEETDDDLLFLIKEML